MNEWSSPLHFLSFQILSASHNLLHKNNTQCSPPEQITSHQIASLHTHIRTCAHTHANTHSHTSLCSYRPPLGPICNVSHFMSTSFLTPPPLLAHCDYLLFELHAGCVCVCVFVCVCVSLSCC